MSAGFKYNMEPEPSIEERYDVSTGVRRRGPYVHDGDKEYFLHIQDPFCVLFGRVSGQTC